MPELSFSKRLAALTGYLHKTLYITVSQREINVRETGGVLRRSDTALYKKALDNAALANPADLVAAIRHALADTGRTRMKTVITLDDTLTRMWIVTPPENAASLDDCKAAAALRFHALYGQSGTDWEIVASWDARRPFLACAMPRALQQPLLALCAEFNLNLQRLEPHFVAQWNVARSALHQQSWFAILHGDVLTLGIASQGRLQSVRSVPANAESRNQRAWLDGLIRREALLQNLAPPGLLLVHGVMPVQWQKNDGALFQCVATGAA